MAEHLGMGQGPFNVEEGQPLIKSHRCGIALHEGRHGLGESARPGLVFLA